MYALVLKMNNGTRKHWMIGERKLVVGRGRECDLVVFDPLVSRRHCELWTVDNIVQFVDLGSSNPTHVNGRPMQQGVLAVGDEVSIGNHTFTVETADATAAAMPAHDDVSTPKTITAEDTPFFKVRPHGASVTSELASFKSLIQHTRRFSEARGVTELCAMMLQLLTVEFAPARSWIVLFQGDAGDVIVRMEEGSADLAAPEMEIRQVWRQRRAISVRATGGSGCAYLIAPMSGPQGFFGAIVLADPRLADTEQGFHYFTALTHTFAPFYQTLERSEQVTRDLERATTFTDVSGALVGSSPQVQAIRRQIENVAQSELNVLLRGETGTGKELVSRLIHNASARAERPYIVVNCPSVPGELFESLMFGHRKGAFTGAHEGRDGFFSEAQGGSLFLDEIGDLPQEYQTRLLRAVELRTYRPVGAPRDQHSDVRIIAATNRTGGPGSASNPIRSDLFHRLAGFEIVLPPLRERRADIPQLAQYFLGELNAAGRARARGFSAEALRRLNQWDWPGNVRELKLCVERASVMCRTEIISTEDIVLWAAEPSDGSCPPVASTLEDVERWHVERVFRHHEGNITATAHGLGISRSTTYEKLREFGVKD